MRLPYPWTAVASYRRLTCLSKPLQRFFSASPHSGPESSFPDTLSARWLPDLKSRIGKCITFGLRPTQTDEAGAILRVLASDWRTLLAGSEGFLVGRGRAGLERHKVVWGDMVGFDE